MIKVEYMGDPNAAAGMDHISPLYKCIEKRVCSFSTAGEAINFRLECTKGLTSLEQLMTEDEFPILEERFLELGDVVLNDEFNEFEEE